MSELSVAEATDAQEKPAARLLREDSEAGFSQVTSDALGVDERCHVILIGEQVAGFIAYRHGTNYLQHFFVGMDWRGRGIGAKALHAFLEQLRASGVQSVSMNWTPNSECFWRRALKEYGFREEPGRQVIELR